MDTAAAIAFIRESFPEITKLQIERFEALEELYREWNSKINVISRKDIGNLLGHHVLHSLAIARYLRTATGEEADFAHGSILDLGTGGGFPGIPLAILYPGGRFTLCDSVGKKTIVASAVAEALSLDNVEVVNARAETLTGPFDYVVSRAVASLTDFYPWIKGRYRKGVLYLKGGDLAEETGAFMARFRFPKGSVRTWKVDSWLGEEYFEGKFVIHF